MVNRLRGNDAISIGGSPTGTCWISKDETEVSPLYENGADVVRGRVPITELMDVSVVDDVKAE